MDASGTEPVPKMQVSSINFACSFTTCISKWSHSFGYQGQVYVHFLQKVSRPKRPKCDLKFTLPLNIHTFVAQKLTKCLFLHIYVAYICVTLLGKHLLQSCFINSFLSENNFASFVMKSQMPCHCLRIDRVKQ